MIVTFTCITIGTQAQYHIVLTDSSQISAGTGVIIAKTSFRGLCVVDEQTVWASGSRGTVARSTDGGKTFVYTQLKGYEKSDFRDIEAFDKDHAVIMSSGTPAYILITDNGGKTWKEVYKNTDSAYFLDAMDFWNNRRGLVIGDPIDGHFVILETKDGGRSWKKWPASQSPVAQKDEAIFAASGTSLKCMPGEELLFCTGGSAARLITGTRKNYTYINTQVIHGKPSQGLFAVTVLGNTILGVGGDYTLDSTGVFNYVMYSGDQLLHRDLSRYYSCIALLDTDKFIVCGTSGVAIDDVGTKLFYEVSGSPFHVVKKSKKGATVFLAGPKGQIGKLVESKK